MSDTLARVPMSAQGIDPWAGYRNFYSAAASQFAPAQAAANVQKTGAETGLLGAQAGQATAQSGLIGAQTTGANIGNQQQQMLLDINSQYYGRLNNPGGATSYPDQEGQPVSGGGGGGGAIGQPVAVPRDFPLKPQFAGGGAAPATAPAPAGQPQIGLGLPPAPGAPAQPFLPSVGLYTTQSDTSDTAPAPGPVQATPLPPPAIGGASAPAGGPLPATGGVGQVVGAGTQSGGPLRTGPGGDYVPGIGALPIMDAMAYRRAAMFGNGPEAAKQAMANRAFRIHQLVQGTIDPQTGRPNPQLWNQAVRQAYYGGLIDSAQESQWYNHPNVIGNVEAANVPTGETPGFKGAVTAAEESAKVGPETAIRQAEPYTLAPGQTRVVPANPGAASQTPISQVQYANNVIGGEGGAGTGPRPNQSGPGGSASSTAGGGAQFLEGTWLQQMRETYPQFAAGKTDQELLALRASDPMAKQLTVDYATHNAPLLAASGIPVNAATLTLAHSLGANGAARVYNAAPNTPMTAIFPPVMGQNGQMVPNPVITANPTYASKTNSDIYGTIANRAGTAPVEGVGSGQAGTAAAPGVTATPAPGGATAIRSDLTPGEVTRQEETARANVKQVTDYQNELLPKAQAAQSMNALIDQARIESESWTSGAFADHKMQALALLDDVRQNLSRLTGVKILGSPDASVGDWQSFNKNMGNIVREAVKATSSRAAVQEFSMIQQALPSDTSSPQGLSQMFDMLQGANDWMQRKSQAAGLMNKDGSVNPNSFDGEWNSRISPMAFIFNRMQPDTQRAWAGKIGATPRGQALLKDLQGQYKFLDRQGWLGPMTQGLPVGRQ